MVGGHLAGGHLSGGPADRPGGYRHQLGGPTSGSGNSAPQGYGLPHVPEGLQAQGLGGPSPGPAGYIVLPPGCCALPHPHGRLPQRGAVHHHLVPLLGEYPPLRPPRTPSLHRRIPRGPAIQAQPPYGMPHAGIPPGPSGSLPGEGRRFPELSTPEEGLQPPGRPRQMAEVPAAGHL